MAQVTFLPQHKSIQVSEGTTILKAARQAGIVIESPCNGAGTCGKCKVRLDQESLKHVAASGKHQLSREEEEQGYVLSCEAKITGDIRVEVIQKQKNETLKILSKGQSFDISLKPYIKKRYTASENETYILAGESPIGSESGDTTESIYGVVVDIGTTTLVASLVNLHSGEELDTASALNPQAVHAQDVLSRIKFASEGDGLEVMYSSLIDEVNGMIRKLTQRTGVSKDNIYEVIFSGNTCMLHLASHTNPESLGKYPYNPKVKGAQYHQAKAHQLEISEYGLIYLPPIISAYVGADITSGVLAAQLHEKKGITLFVDIGTNGEMVISFDGRLSATSTAAGPAFEGMNITHGMRAGEGAIELFEINDKAEITLRVIGQTKAIGICGSGLLDIVGELVAAGVINKSGKFIDHETGSLPSTLKERLVKQDGKLVFQVTQDVYLSQKDVRQVQLAKGAVRAGIEFLLDSKGVKASDVDKVLIAGSFGYHLRAKSLINLGLLPREFEGKIDFVGNTSKSGGQAFLLNEEYRNQMKQVVQEVEVLELANYKDFDKVFVRCLGF
ncbi:MAG: ASKHA domain-containing protein [Clostridia bacterium]|nr:ASKHA domain-containing protein [Clostridia bacterium]